MHAGKAADALCEGVSQQNGVTPRRACWYWDPVKGRIYSRSDTLRQFPQLVRPCFHSLVKARATWDDGSETW